MPLALFTSDIVSMFIEKYMNFAMYRYDAIGSNPPKSQQSPLSARTYGICLSLSYSVFPSQFTAQPYTQNYN